MATSSGQAKIPVRYDFSPGHVLARKYEVLSRVGAGTSGELYRLTEQATGIERTGKFFYPHLDPTNRVATRYARKLHRLRHCDMLLPYRTQETISLGGRDVTFLVSDLAKGEPLKDFVARQTGGRLSEFEGLHLLHALAAGVEKVHEAGEHHGELLPQNVLVRRRGLGFQVKLIDLSASQEAKAPSMQDDVCDLVDIFYQAIGGTRFYQKASKSVKGLCLGNRKNALRERYRDAGDLKRQLESLNWS